MMVTKSIAGKIRKGLCIVAFVPGLLLPACGDKEEAPGPSYRSEISRANEAVEHEKSQRLLAESRLGTVLWLAVLGAGGALMLGLAIGSSSRRDTDGPETEKARRT